jgi:uncharacterized membrane protein
MDNYNNFIIANKELRISHIIPITIILALTAFYCVFPLYFHKGLPHSPDAIFHLFYADHFKQALAEGFLYPRWVLEANYGYGGPHFIFYSPLSYYFYAAVTLLHSSPVISMITAIWLSFLLSGLTMFIVLVKQSGKIVSLIVAIIYQIIPFHFFDLYERGSYAELFAFVWIPLIIFFMLRLTDAGNRLNIVGLAISYAGLVLTHLVSGFMITFIIGLFVVYHGIMKRNKQVIFGSVFAIILGIGLSSFYLLPVIFERQYVHIEYLLECTFCDYKQNFLFTQNMFHLPNLPIYYVVILHTIFAFEVTLFILLILFIVTHRKRLVRTPSIVFFIMLFIISCFLATPISKPLWAIIPFFPTLQFPWRWFLFMDVSLCFLIGSILTAENMAELKKSSFSKRSFVSIFIILLGFSSVIMYMRPMMPEKFLTEIIYTEKIKDYVPHTIEYIPRWVNVPALKSQETYSPASVISGEGRYEVLDWKTERRIFKILSSTPIQFRVRTFFYPGWKAYVNGSEIAIQTESTTGAMLIDIPKDTHILELKFIDTPIRRYAKILSLATLFGMGIALILRKCQK